MIFTKHETGTRPPFDAYYTAEIDECGLQVYENQSLDCLTIMDATAESEPDMIHICDVDKFIKALQEFQAMRAELPKYAVRKGERNERAMPI